LILLAFLSLSVRFGTYWAVGPVDLTGDEVRYVRAASQLRQGDGYGVGGTRDARWPPAQSFFLSLFLSESRTSTPDFRSLDPRSLIGPQLALAALLALLTALLGRALFDSKTALLAGLLAALYPTFVGYSHYFWSETLLMVLTTAALILAIRAARNNRLLEAALAGLLFGVAGLTREIAVLLAVGTSIWWIVTVPRLDRRRATARALLMLVCSGIVILPWTVRNFRLLDRFVPVSTVFWMGMREGNTLQSENWLRPNRQQLTSFRAQMASFSDEWQGVEFAQREALELIQREQPTWIFKKLVRNSALLFGPDSFVFKKISRGCYGEPALWAVRLVLVSTLLAYLGIVIGGLFGITTSPDLRRRLLPVLVLSIIAVVHILAQASSRYRLPLMPLLMVYAAAWATAGFPLRRLSPRSLVACALCLAILLGWCVPYFWNDALALWSSGTYSDPWRP
jgi:4-amino-4-deoxy-L-arabinose transferase-like glycosyltransferase